MQDIRGHAGAVHFAILIEQDGHDLVGIRRNVGAQAVAKGHAQGGAPLQFA